MAEQLELFENARNQWEAASKASSTRDYSFDTLSGETVDPLYYPDVPADDYLEKLGFPGPVSYTHLSCRRAI